MNIPPEHELLELFEAEPVVLEPGMPWVYNSLTFTTQRGQDDVRCVLVPGYSEIELTWTRDGRVLVQLSVEHVEAVRAETDGSGERLVATFNEKAMLLPLILNLKPFVSVQWGTRV